MDDLRWCFEGALSMVLMWEGKYTQSFEGQELGPLQRPKVEEA
jgi:hypothetical protein